jgi:hypothetical protein
MKLITWIIVGIVYGRQKFEEYPSSEIREDGKETSAMARSRDK